MNRLRFVLAGAVPALCILAWAFPLQADDLYVGTSSGISLFDIASVVGGGTSPTGSFGPLGAVTGFSDGQGNVWVVTYSSGVSTVQKYDGSGNPIAGDTFQVAASLQNGVVGPGGNLDFSGPSGEIYEYSSSTLTQVTDWNIATGNANLAGQGTQYTAIGIGSNGTNLFTTEGDEGSFIDQWSGSGTLQSSVDVGVYGLYGLGLDGGDFFAGTPSTVLEFDTSGTYENGFGIGESNFSLSAGPGPVPVVPPPPPPSTAPEPGSAPLVLLAGLIAGVFLHRFRAKRAQTILGAALTVGFLALPAAYGQVSLSIMPSASSAAIGQTITVSASASDPSNSSATFTYQFNLLPPGVSNHSLIRDYSPVNSFPFTTTGPEGVYTIQVVALESNGMSTRGTAPLTFTPVATSAPVVSATANPLVAMYSLPPCPAGSQARVHFRLEGTFLWTYTPYQNCTGNTSLNFLIGGMRASSTYTLQHDIFTGPVDTLGPMMGFTTGAIPSTALSAIPSYNIGVGATSPNSTAYPVLLTAPVANGTTEFTPFAVDTAGKLIWYLPDLVSSMQQGSYMTHPVPGGTFLVIANLHGPNDKQLLREYDLAGNLLRETNATAISAELATMGKNPITSISHEIFRFPNGDTGFIGTVEKIIPTAYDSSTNTVHSNVDVLGDMAVVLDSNFHLKWSWNEFDHYQEFATTWPSTGAPLPPYTGDLDETCLPNGGCPLLENINPATGQVYTVANDWTHSNSLAPAPDGNLIISIRHQDMVVKITYNDGSGNGDIQWKLGPQGSFASSVPTGLTPYQFFNTHEHDAEYDPATGLLSLFDNGNTRVSLYGGNSRGQAWQIDGANLTATRVVNIELGAYSRATGSAQRLANNNYHFYLGFISPNSRSVEVTTSGADEFELVLPSAVGYRSFRMNSLY